MSRGHSLARWVRRWHARLGVAAAIFFVVLIVTGLALNHTASLNLAQTELRWPLLARWYGMRPPAILNGVALDPPLVATADVWLHGGRPLADGGGALVGAVRTPQMLAVAAADRISLYTPDGVPIDTLRGAALPGSRVQAIGLRGQDLMVRVPRGLFASADGLAWTAATDAGVHWSHAVPLTSQQQRDAARHLVAGLPLERVLLDLHSGRLLGRYGPLLMDAAAVVLLALSFSGVWMQWRSRQQKRRHPHAR